MYAFTFERPTTTAAAAQLAAAGATVLAGGQTLLASMKLRLACSDYTFPLLPHDHVFPLVAALGFDGIDVGLFQDR